MTYLCDDVGGGGGGGGGGGDRLKHYPELMILNLYNHAGLRFLEIWCNIIITHGQLLFFFPKCTRIFYWRSECSHSRSSKSRFAIDICLVRANYTEHARKRSSP